jgi:hypothetical protein
MQSLERLEKQLQDNTKEVDSLHLLYSKKFVRLEASLATQQQSYEELQLQHQKELDAMKQLLVDEKAAHQQTRDSATALTNLLKEKVL